MTVAEVLSVIPLETMVRIEQVPIKRIDTCESPVERQYTAVFSLAVDVLVDIFDRALKDLPESPLYSC